MLSPEAKPKADTPAQTGRTSMRKRKQADFFVPDDVKKSEKPVIKEVSAAGPPARAWLVESPWSQDLPRSDRGAGSHGCCGCAG